MNNMNISLTEVKQIEKGRDLESYVIDSIVSKIRNYRIHYGVSQRELSRRSGVTHNIISRMECRKATPHFPTLIKLLQALNLDIEVTINPRRDNGDSTFIFKE